MPIRSHFEALGVQTSTYEFGGGNTIQPMTALKKKKCIYSKQNSLLIYLPGVAASEQLLCGWNNLVSYLTHKGSMGHLNECTKQTISSNVVSEITKSQYK